MNLSAKYQNTIDKTFEYFANVWSLINASNQCSVLLACVEQSTNNIKSENINNVDMISSRNCNRTLLILS